MSSPATTRALESDLSSWRFSTISFGPDPSLKIDLTPKSREEQNDGQPPEQTTSLHPLLGDNSNIPPIETPIPLQSKKRQLWFTIILFIIAIPFSGFLFYYLIQVLIENDPKIGSTLLLLGPSETLLLVTVLSQSLVMLNHLLMNRILDVFRWQLAMREKGVEAPVFFVLGSSISFIGAFQMLRLGGKTTLWSLHKLLTPVLFSFTNVVLKAQITYPEVYTVQNTTQMFSGLAPLNTSTLLQAHVVATSVICTYFSGNVANILSVPKYVAEAQALACHGPDCSSIFLPGGVEQMRLINTSFGGTLLQNGFLDGPDAITSYHTSGYQLDLYPALDFEFDAGSDCKLYGVTSGQGLYMCVAVDADSNLIIGWSACPSKWYDVDLCISDTTWTESLQQKITVSTWKRYAQVTYDSKNLSILDAAMEPWNEAVNYTAADFRLAYDTALDDNATSLSPSGNNSSQPDPNLYMVESLLYQLGWVLRLYMDFFPTDHKTPTDLLKSMVVIPIQFSTAAWQKVNSTYAFFHSNSTLYALPSDLVTRVSTVRRTPRVMAVTWSVYTFVGVVSGVYLYALMLFLWLMWQKEEIPHISDFAELNFASKVTKPYLEMEAWERGGSTNGNARSRLNYLDLKDLSNAPSEVLIKQFRNKVIRVVVRQGEKRSIAILTSGSEGNEEPLVVGKEYY